jgi:hypothetical protein
MKRERAGQQQRTEEKQVRFQHGGFLHLRVFRTVHSAGRVQARGRNAKKAMSGAVIDGGSVAESVEARP